MIIKLFDHKSISTSSLSSSILAASSCSFIILTISKSFSAHSSEQNHLPNLGTPSFFRKASLGHAGVL